MIFFFEFFLTSRRGPTWIMKDEEQGLLHPDGSRVRRYVFQQLLISAGLQIQRVTDSFVADPEGAQELRCLSW
jgi:hypothetical protein